MGAILVMARREYPAVRWARMAWIAAVGAVLAMALYAVALLTHAMS